MSFKFKDGVADRLIISDVFGREVTRFTIIASSGSVDNNFGTSQKGFIFSDTLLMKMK